MNVGESVTFNYSGDIQSLTIDTSGYYQLECWGGQAGNVKTAWEERWSGGQGGYTRTYVKLKKGDVLYIGVGGQGQNSEGPGNWSTYVGGGWNGGANGGSVYDYDAGNYNNTGGGGGATHIALNNNRGTLNNYSSYQDEVLGVAGGGGGATYASSRGWGNGGSGGGTSGGESGVFGKAPNGSAYPGGGGGGWEGGRNGNWVNESYYRTTYGGTGHYKNASLVIGGVTYTSTTTNGGKSGTGQAKITFLKKASSVYVGDTQADTLYVGDNEVDALYVGDNEA